MCTINIFWIEDNPVQDDFVVRDGVPYPSFNITGSNGQFTFKLFQHPVEVQEYLSMVNTLHELDYLGDLGKSCSRAIPDIVVFDYKLSDNFSASNPKALQYSHPAQHAFLERHSASLELKQCFKDEFGSKTLFLDRNDVVEGNYDRDELLESIGVRDFEGNQDNEEFGLYAGIAIIREFKDFITLGVPATFNKADTNSVSPNSLFYEWLNSYDMVDAIHRPDKSSKNWDDIVKFSLPLLRRRIVNQVRSRKITPSFEQLNRLTTIATLNNEVLSFNSAYGERHFPLSGLFLDEPEEKRVQKIKEYAKLLVNNLPGNQADILKAVDVSNMLWTTYVKKYGMRMDISALTYWENKGELNSEQKDRLEKLKSEFGFREGETSVETSIQTLFQGTSNEVNYTVRLAILHLVTRAAIEMNKCKKHAPGKSIYRELEQYEYFNMLYPEAVLGTDLMLPMHKDSKTEKGEMIGGGKKWIIRRLGCKEGDWSNFERWITPAERSLLRSIYFLQDDYYPGWLK